MGNDTGEISFNSSYLEDPTQTRNETQNYIYIVFGQINRISKIFSELGNTGKLDRLKLLNLYYSIRNCETLVAPFRKDKKPRHLPAPTEFSSYTDDELFKLTDLLIEWHDEQIKILGTKIIRDTASWDMAIPKLGD